LNWRVLDRLEEAVTYYDKALEIEPDNKEYKQERDDLIKRLQSR
jgi:tetratricopeptide (TPR) repeat protein